jgi:hypothetical protein
MNQIKGFAKFFDEKFDLNELVELYSRPKANCYNQQTIFMLKLKSYFLESDNPIQVFERSIHSAFHVFSKNWIYLDYMTKAEYDRLSMVYDDCKTKTKPKENELGINVLYM